MSLAACVRPETVDPTFVSDRVVFRVKGQARAEVLEAGAATAVTSFDRQDVIPQGRAAKNQIPVPILKHVVLVPDLRVFRAIR